jgi:5-carboxymethyl-2-hydroxymuconic-semialdehyde dehydrogenase
MRIDHLIDGKAVAGRDYFTTVNPATQEALAEVAAGGEAEVHAAVAAAKAAFPKWAGLPAPSAPADPQARRPDRQHVPEIAQTETNDCGQVIAQTGKQLVPRAADNFYYFAEMCTRVDGHTYPTPTHLNYTLFHPVGVCALISPWNVPFIPPPGRSRPACLRQHRGAEDERAVAADGRAPGRTGARGRHSARRAEPRARLRQGGGRAAGGAPRRARDLVHRSTATGNRIVKSAGLKKFSMELGGKSPFVIFDDADLDRALDAGVFMIFSNNGERCTAGSRILVQHSIYADFAAEFAERAKRITVGDPLDEKTIVGPDDLAGASGQGAQLHRAGPKEGATLLCGGLGAPELSDRVKKGNYVLPTVFADVDNRMKIAQDEIFGPVACLIPFKDEAGCDPARERHPIWPVELRLDREHRQGHRVAAAVEAGMCFVNSQNVRDLRQPLRRHQGLGHGARRRHVELRCLLRAEERGRLSRSAITFRTGSLIMGKLALAAKITQCHRCTCRSSPARTRLPRRGDQRPQGNRPPLPRARRRHHRGLRRPTGR